MTRTRKHIPLIEIAAAFAAGMIEAQGEPNEILELREMEADRRPAQQLLRLFTPDHKKLHAWGGADRWWNLNMKRRGPALKAKDRADTSRAAKALRIDEKYAEARRAILKGRKPRKRKSRWPKRKFRN